MKINYLIIFLFVSCSKLSLNKFEIKGTPKIKSHSFIKIGGLSGLNVNKADKTELISITDRGPNTKAKDFNKDGIRDRGFIQPKYNPQIIILEKSKNEIKFKKSIALRYENKKASGLPNQRGFDEMPFNSKEKRLKFDQKGIDPEGIVKVENFYWIVEEYGPSLLKVDLEGNIVNRYVPDLNKSRRFGLKKLPEVLAYRKLNRGFEGITLLSNKLYLVLQSPIPFKNWKDQRIGHLIEFDPKTEETTGHYLFSFDKKGRKIGALATYKNKILMLEQNADTFKTVFSLDLKDATNFLGFNIENLLKTHKDLKSEYNLIKKDLLIDLTRYSELTEQEKIEGMDVYNSSLLLIIDNDFDLDDEDDQRSYLFEAKL